MRHNNFIYIILGAAAGLLSPACTKIVISDDAGTSADAISFRESMSDMASKSLITDAGLTDETIVVNDLHVIDGASSPDLYMDGVSYRYISGEWQTLSGKEYYWTKTGIHYFSAHIAGQDANFDYSNGTDRSKDAISWSGKLSTENQPDVLYAFAERNVETAANPTAPVELNFSHAFAAVRINITNVNRNNLRISDCRFDGISVSGDFSATRDGAVTYSIKDKRTNRYLRENMNTAISIGGSLNPYSSVDAIGSDGSILVWPQDVDENTVFNIGYSDAGTSGTVDAKASLNSGNISRWYAGRCYVYNINMSDDKINITVEIEPWVINDVIIGK